jgi:hypothetical protein
LACVRGERFRERSRAYRHERTWRLILVQDNDADVFLIRRALAQVTAWAAILMPSAG